MKQGAVQEAVETAAAVADETGGLGTPGQPLNRRSPFFVGFFLAFVALLAGEWVLRRRWGLV